MVRQPGIELQNDLDTSHTQEYQCTNALCLRKCHRSSFSERRDDNLYFDTMRDLFLDCGYETEFMTLSAEDYGVLQSRKRIILVGRRGKATGFYPEPDKWTPDVLVREVFRDLPTIGAGEGGTGPCHVRPYRGTWQYEAGIRNEKFPVTWHQARPNTEQDLEIYRIAVNLRNSKKVRLDYNALPDRLKPANKN